MNAPLSQSERLIAEALEVHDHGLPVGDSTGWRSLGELFRVGMEQWTLVTGIPHSGKSEWLDALMVNLLERNDDWGFAIYSPENFPTHTHLIKLAEKVARQPFNPGPTERMTKATFADVAEMLTRRIHWINPRDRTVPGILTAATERPFKHKKLGIILDPWNTFEHARAKDETEAQYLSRSLTTVTEVVQDFGCHIFIVAHPAKLDRGTNGKRPVPTPYDVSGGAHWYNKADNIICVHRDQSEPDSNVVEIHIQKVRRKWLGHIGVATLRYDKITGRYTDDPGACPDGVL